jgi:AraC-like DNA-binding protein
LQRPSTATARSAATAPLGSAPLSRHPLIHTRDPREAAAFCARLGAPLRFDVMGRSQAFEWRANRISLGSAGISVHTFGSGVALHADPFERFFALTISIGRMGGEGSQDAHAIPLLRGRSAWLASPGHSASARLGVGHRCLVVDVQARQLETALMVLTGAAPTAPLCFEPMMSLAAPAGQTLVNLLSFIVREADREQSSLVSPLVAACLAEALLFQLLQTQPHNHSAVLRAPARSCEPVHLRHAAEYIEVNLTRPIRMSELARAAGTSVRSLQLGFRKHRGCSPVEFLRLRRLLRARAMLRGSGSMTVAQVAFACGFEHLGRFSAHYRSQFGESPGNSTAQPTKVRRSG